MRFQFARFAEGRSMALLLLGFVLGACDGSPADDGDPAAAAWTTYRADVDAARRRLLESDFADDPVLRAEADRYLSGLIALHQRQALHFGDPAFPTLVRPVAIGNKWGFSNPDNLYLSAQVEGGAVYRVTGRLGSANQTTIGSYAGDDENARAGPRVRGEDLVTDADGTFELVLGGERTSGNWLPLDPEATSITIYQIFADWEREQKGRFRIERVDSVGRAPAPLSPDRVAEHIRRAGAQIVRTVDTWLDVAERLAWIPANTFAPPREIQVASLGAWFVAGRYALAPGEQLLVELPEPTNARYWGFTLYDPWSETLDYANRQTSLNHRQSVAAADGLIRLVLAAEDPGVANWLDVTGHAAGFVTWRVTSPDEPPRPRARIVGDAEIASLVAAGALTPISPGARRAVIASRQAHVAWRYAE